MNVQDLRIDRPRRARSALRVVSERHFHSADSTVTRSELDVVARHRGVYEQGPGVPERIDLNRLVRRA